MVKLNVYLPCYNEEGNIVPLVGEWLAEEDKLRAAGYELAIIPIDDKSRDNTLSLMRQLEAAHPQVRIIAHEENKNLGGGLNTALEDFLACCGEGDLMCVMDGDNTQKPRFIHAMLEQAKSADCVIASRYQKGAEVFGVPAARRFLSDGAKLYYTLVLRVPGVRDYTCGYRVYRYGAVRTARAMYGDELVTMRTFSCMMELLYKLHRSGASFREVPFSLYYDEKEGASKMRILNTVKDSFLTALQLKAAAKKQVK